MDLKALQSEIWHWAQTVMPRRTPGDAIKKLSMEEVPELWRALKETGQLDPDELADIGIIWLDLCEMAGVDPLAIIRDKMAINWDRQWKVVEGVLTHEK